MAWDDEASTGCAAMQLKVRSVRQISEAVKLFELVDPMGGELPAFEAGAHIELSLMNGLRRSYSLVNAPDDRSRYEIAVAKDSSSRGGSAFLHHAVSAGDALSVGRPDNNFSLAADAVHSVLIAGGIGITPIWSMMQQLERDGSSFELLYCARSRGHAAFLEEIGVSRASAESRVTYRFDDEHESLLDLSSILIGKPQGTHFYCCGPAPMLNAYEAAGKALRSEFVHLERFTGTLPAAGGGFTVVLARSGRSIEIAAGASILDTLLDEGIDVDFSCMEGICGSCRVGVVEGIPDHRDSFLTAAEKAAGKAMMICCSGCEGSKIVLDL